MPVEPPSAVVIVGGPETLEAMARALRRRGRRVHRIVTLEVEPVPLRALRPRLDRFGGFNAVLLTSVPGAESYLRLSRAAGPGARPRRRSLFAIGPTTEAYLRRHRVRVDWTPEESSSRAMLDHLASTPPLRILHPRSNLAGTAIARALTRQGHTVLDLVTYRVRPPDRLPPASQAWLAPPNVVLVGSPSALAHLRRLLPPGGFRRWRATARIYVLGAKTARAARGHGFRDVRIASVAGLGRGRAPWESPVEVMDGG